MTRNLDPAAAFGAQISARLIDKAFPDHPLPDVVAHPEVQKAANAYKAARDAYNAAQAESGTTMTRYEAEQLDLAAMADAVEAGKPTDATPNVDQHDRERARHLRQTEALAVVASSRERELRQAVDKHRQTLIDKHRADTERRAATIMGLLDDLAAECVAVAEDIRKREWAESFPNWPGRARVWGRPLITARPRGQAPITSDDLLGGIRAALADVLTPPDEPATNFGPAPEAA